MDKSQTNDKTNVKEQHQAQVNSDSYHKHGNF